MKRLCVVLIDLSPSMSAAVEPDPHFLPQTRCDRQLTKLDLAKQGLLEAITGAGLEALVVITAGAEPSIVYHSHLDDLNASVAAVAIDGIRPSREHINVGSAMECVRGVIQEYPGAPFARVFIVTDENDLAAELTPSAYDHLHADSLRVDTIVILAHSRDNPVRLSDSLWFVGSVFAFQSILSDDARDLAYPDVVPGAAMPGRTRSGSALVGAEKSPQALLGVIAIFATVVSLAAAVAGYFTNLLERPGTAIPIGGASLGLIAASIMLYIVFVKDVSAAGIYRSALDAEPYYPKVPRYKKWIRLLALFMGVVCIISSAVLLVGVFGSDMVHAKPTVPKAPEHRPAQTR